MGGILDKKKGFWSRRRMFLLTEGPRLFYVDPKEKVVKGEIRWSADMKTEMKDFRIFFVHTPGRVYYLIDPASFASKWCEAIESVRRFYFQDPSLYEMSFVMHCLVLLLHCHDQENQITLTGANIFNSNVA